MVGSSQVRIGVVGRKAALATQVRQALSGTGYELIALETGEDLEQRAADCQLQVLLLEFDPAQRAMLTVVARLSERWTTLLLGAQEASRDVVQALRAGASGYVLGNCIGEELGLALRTVLDGYRYLSPRVCAPLFDLAVGGREDSAPDCLTERQKEVLYWLVKGNCTKEIAYLMNLSIKTVNAHKIRLKERLGIHDMASLVLYALRQGIIDLPF